jgi:carbonic anhydrase/acetyltransferase-like protein (isoleucine patch superfamily)
MFYCYRKSIKELVLKFYNYFPLPWIKVLVLKLFNIKIPTNSGVLDSYIDSDFIKFGNEVILGEGSVVMSSMIIRDTLIVKEVIIKDGCTVGVNSVIAPGTLMEKKSILGMGSYTKINQRLEEGWIYVGKPAKKLSKITEKHI